MVDKHKSVQYASCSALLYLQESTKVVLLPYYQHLITAFAAALQLYQVFYIFTFSHFLFYPDIHSGTKARNKEILYDTLGYFAKSSVRYSSNDDAKCKLAGVLFPLLVNHYNSFQDDDKTICVASDCISDIINSVNSHYVQPFSQDIFARALRIVDTSLINFAVCFFHFKLIS